MKRVYKYELPVEDSFTLSFPAGAEILSVQAQFNVPCLWALVDTSNEAEPVEFATRGTGHDASGLGEHVGSYQLGGGAFVGHVFRKRT